MYTRVDCKNEKEGDIFIIIFNIWSLYRTQIWVIFKENESTDITKNNISCFSFTSSFIFNLQKIIILPTCTFKRPIDLFSFYTIVGPKILRPNSEYHVAVSTQGTTSPTTIVVDVGGKQDSGGVLKVTQFVKVDPFSTRIVRLEVSLMCIICHPIFVINYSNNWFARLKSKKKHFLLWKCFINFL